MATADAWLGAQLNKIRAPDRFFTRVGLDPL